jgi:hypothetical protein
VSGRIINVGGNVGFTPTVASFTTYTVVNLESFTALLDSDIIRVTVQAHVGFMSALQTQVFCNSLGVIC